DEVQQRLDMPAGGRRQPVALLDDVVHRQGQMIRFRYRRGALELRPCGEQRHQPQSAGLLHRRGQPVHRADMDRAHAGSSLADYGQGLPKRWCSSSTAFCISCVHVTSAESSASVNCAMLVAPMMLDVTKGRCVTNALAN